MVAVTKQCILKCYEAGCAAKMDVNDHWEDIETTLQNVKTPCHASRFHVPCRITSSELLMNSITLTWYASGQATPHPHYSHKFPQINFSRETSATTPTAPS